jgi:hypothetical protein
MTDIRELLLEATSDVQVEETNPVRQVQRAARHRQSWLVAACVAAVVVIGGGGFALDSRYTTDRPPTKHVPSTDRIDRWSGTANLEVAVGFDSAYTFDPVDDNDAETQSITVRDPRTGAITGTYPGLPGIQHIATGAGRVWAFGPANPSSAGAIYAINPANGRINRIFLRSSRTAPHAIAFAYGAAWLTFPLRNQVWRLTPTPTGVTKTVVAVSGGPLSIASTGDGQLWVQRTHAPAVNLVSTLRGGQLGPTTRTFQQVFSTTERDRLWVTTDSPGLDRVQFTSVGCGANQCATVDKRIAPPKAGYSPESVVETSAGLFVLWMYTGSGNLQPQARGTAAFYSWAALNHASPTPTATVSVLGALTADGNGVLIAAENGIVRWTPGG